jgi:hypothetical protein
LQEDERSAKRSSQEAAPNKGIEPTASSVHCAPASGSR